MNSVLNNNDSAPAAAQTFAPEHKTSSFKLLLQREYWEHKGGFFWAPLIASTIFLFFTLIGGGAGQMWFQREGSIVNYDGKEVPLSQVNWAELMSKASPSELENMQHAINGSLLIPAILPMMIFGFVVFFFFLGALYDERKDRSVLFWKSLPVSDRNTVLSKLSFGLIVGPVLAIGIGLVAMLCFAILMCVLLAMNGAPIGLFLSQLKPLTLIGSLIAFIPMYALWALPTAGWLLLCSAWAKSKPFLWAIMIPLFTGLLITWFNLLRVFNLESSWVWQHVIARLLTSAWPGSHLTGVATSEKMNQLQNGFDMNHLVSTTAAVDLLSSPHLWIGAIAGATMIFVAIRLRRWRDEG